MRKGKGEIEKERERVIKIILRNLKKEQERWRRYPDENWVHEIPKPKKQMIGIKTQWKKGQSGRKTKATLQKHTLNSTNHPIGADPKDEEAPNEVYPSSS